MEAAGQVILFMPDKQPNIKKNILFQSFYQILSVVTPFITAPYLSRVLGPEGIGIQSYTASYAAYFSMFATLGTVTYGSREISRARNDRDLRSRLFWEIEALTVFTSLLTLVGWFLFIGFHASYRVYYVILTMNILTSMMNISWFFSGLELFGLIVARDTFFKVLGIASVFLFVKSRDDLALYVALTSAMSLFSALSLWPYLRKRVRRVSVRELRVFRHFGKTWVYFIPTAATSIYTVLDKTLIGLITRETVENGYYQQADKIVSMMKSVVFGGVNSVVGVRISYLFAEEKYAEIHARIRSSMHYIFFMGFGCVFGLTAVARNFVPLFFGDGYEKVVSLLYIISPIVLIIGVSNCLGSHYYTPSGRRAQSTRYIIAGSALNLLLNLLLIPLWKSTGAALASVAAELLVTVLYVCHCDSYMPLSVFIQCGAKKCLAGCAMFAVVWHMGDLPGLPILILAAQIGVGVLLYLFTLLFLKDQWTLAAFHTAVRSWRRLWRGRTAR